MLSKASMNVISAKARAMYKNRITSVDYENLLMCKDLKEVILYLKNNTWYSDILKDIDENNIKRSYVEMLIKKKVFYDLSALCRYQISTRESFLGYIISRIEIEEILHSLIFLASNKSSNYVYSLPIFFDKHTKIKLKDLVGIKNYDDFLEAIKFSEYREILEKFRPIGSENFDLAKIEDALYSHLYEKLKNVINNIPKRDRQDIRDIFNTSVDFENFVKIVRARRRNVNISEEMLSFGTFNKKQINDMLDADSEEQIFQIMEKTKNGSKLSKIEYSYLDQIKLMAVSLTCYKKIRFSSVPSAVMLAYIFLMEIEISNIVIIMEGVRYGMDKTELKNLLVLRN